MLAVGLLAAGGLAMARGGLPGGPATGAAAPEVPTGTASLVRTDIVERQQVAGRLGYDGPFFLAWPRGADVAQVEANLVALGFDPGRVISVDQHDSWATAVAVRRWQRAAGLPRTGAIPLGRVLVTLPDGSTIDGRVRSVGRVATVPGAEAEPDQGGDGSGAGQATVSVTVGLADPRAAANLDQTPVQVAIATETSRNVLAAPITALLAEPGGGYAVALVEGGGRRLVEVETGFFDETTGLVEVDGQGLAEGATVEVPAP